MRAALLLILSLVVGCGDDIPGQIAISAAPPFQAAVGEFVALMPRHSGVVLGGDGAFDIKLLEEPTIHAEGYQLQVGIERTEIVVRASDVLGAQYGVAAALEALGFSFRHPFDIHVPSPPVLDAARVDGVTHTPEIRVRGYQLHTLHPIESYYAFWEPSPGSTNDAHRIIDWIIKNRGNYVQWVGLDDILDADRHAAWKPFTRELIDYAHARGVRVGFNLQLFGQSNLQLAFDLVDKDPTVTPIPEQIAARLPLITADLPFDVYDLSFGEFFNVENEAAIDEFVGAIDEVKRQLDVLAPQAELHGFIHVGDEQRVSYRGEDNLLFYFLLKFADPAIIHDVHTTMFYNLFETTSGAYHHEDFSEHRQHLFDQMCSGRRGVYVPETAYWVAFDVSVPQYLPLYVHNRWLDLDQIRAQSPCPEVPLDAHVLFSTGWEWGYWLHDVTALRASYELPATPRALVEDAFGADLAAAVDPVMALSDLQREYLHHADLMAYIAGRAIDIDAGRTMGIVSQPDRITFDDLVGGASVPAFTAGVISPLKVYADRLDAIAAQLADAALPATVWGDELRDGFAIDRLRVRFVIAVYEATLAHLGGADADAHLDEARRLLDDANAVVQRRHADLHDTHRRRLLDSSSDAHPNQTFYQYGYLYMADTLCFWRRELAQVEGIVGQASMPPPGCLFP